MEALYSAPLTTERTKGTREFSVGRGSTSLGLFIHWKSKLQNKKSESHMVTVQSRVLGQDHVPTNYTGTHFKVIGIISNLQQSVRSESSLKISPSHYLHKATRAASNSSNFVPWLPQHSYQLPLKSGRSLSVPFVI